MFSSEIPNLRHLAHIVECRRLPVVISKLNGFDDIVIFWFSSGYRDKTLRSFLVQILRSRQPSLIFSFFRSHPPNKSTTYNAWVINNHDGAEK